MIVGDRDDQEEAEDGNGHFQDQQTRERERQVIMKRYHLETMFYVYK